MTRLFSIVLLLHSMAAGDALGQLSPCLPDDSTAVETSALLRHYVSSARSDAMYARANLGIPAAGSADVIHISDAGLCAAAVAAFDSAYALPQSGRRLQVFRIDSVFVVYDPAVMGPGIEFRRYATLATTFAVLTKWAK